MAVLFALIATLAAAIEVGQLAGWWHTGIAGANWFDVLVIYPLCMACLSLAQCFRYMAENRREP